MYWSQEQIFLFKKFMKINDTDNLSIDATGSLIKFLLKTDGFKASYIKPFLISSSNIIKWKDITYFSNGPKNMMQIC